MNVLVTFMHYLEGAHSTKLERESALVAYEMSQPNPHPFIQKEQPCLLNKKRTTRVRSYEEYSGYDTTGPYEYPNAPRGRCGRTQSDCL